MRLTDLQIRKMRPPQTGQRTYFDEAQPGFGLRVSQGGSKSFVVVYGKRRQLKTLGRYPDMTLADARRAAKKMLGDVAIAKGDGSIRPEISFSDAQIRFLSDTASRTKASTTEEYHRLLHKHFTFAKNLSDLSRAHIMEIIEVLKDTPSERHHAFVAIRTMMNWCHRHGLIDASPVPPLKFKTSARTRVLSDDELRTVWNRAKAYGHPYGSIIQLLILTGQRRGEIVGLRRSWIADDEIIFPVGFTKNKREHRFPISEHTRDIIESLPGDSDFLFPSRTSAESLFSGWSKSKRAFDRGIGVANYTLHDLRRTYSSSMARLGVPIHVTERLLNHVSGTVSGISAVYNRHTYMPEMREAITRYEAFLATTIHTSASTAVIK